MSTNEMDDVEADVAAVTAAPTPAPIAVDIDQEARGFDAYTEAAQSAWCDVGETIAREVAEAAFAAVIAKARKAPRLPPPLDRDALVIRARMAEEHNAKLTADLAAMALRAGEAARWQRDYLDKSEEAHRLTADLAASRLALADETRRRQGMADDLTRLRAALADAPAPVEQTRHRIRRAGSHGHYYCETCGEVVADNNADRVPHSDACPVPAPVEREAVGVTRGAVRRTLTISGDPEIAGTYVHEADL